MALNGNNFLRWTGKFKNPLPSFIAVPTITNLYADQNSITVTPLSGYSSPNGIDKDSFKVLKIINVATSSEILLESPLEWDGTNLVIYRPQNISVTDFIIYFDVNDYLGNSCKDWDYYSNGGSNNEYIEVIVSAIVVQWVSYPPSALCTLDSFGNNTGYLSWTQLKLINQGTGLDISPLQLKDNVPSDMDYIAPITDYITCPVIGVGDYAPLFIGNYTKNQSDPSNFITITNIVLSSSNMGVGGSPITINISCNITQGSTQRFNVPAIFWDNGITISYSITGNMVTASPQRFWLDQISGVLDGFPTSGRTSNPVDNSGIFGNFAITVPNTSNGITIFAQ